MNSIVHHEYELRTAHDMGRDPRSTTRVGSIEFGAFERAFGTAKLTLAQFLSNAFRAIGDGIRERQTSAELSRLSDHVLADMGIERDQIATVTKGLVASRRKALQRAVTSRQESLSTGA